MTTFRAFLRRLLILMLGFGLFASACSDSSDDLASTSDDVGVSDADDGGTDSSAGKDTTTDDAAGGDDADSSGDAEMADEEAAVDTAVEAGDASDSDGARSSETEPADEPVSPSVPPQPQPRAGLLTAADIDDNLNLDYFAGLVSDWQQAEGRTVPYVELRDRVVVEVTGENGVGVGNTPIEVDDGAITRTIVTNGAGQAFLYPTWLGLDDEQGLAVTVGGQSWNVSAEELASGRIGLDVDGDTTPPGALDVALVLDVTGSMADELRYLTVEFESIIGRVEDDYGNVDMRFALIVYRDEGDDFVTRVFDFTGDVGEMQQWLAEQQANGGGDFPEAMDAALIDAEELSWRDGDDVARVLILNADAPPHTPQIEAALASARELGQDGVRIYPLAASGVDRNAEFIMRAMAVTTGGRHLFLTSDSGIGGEKLEPKAECYLVTGLDDLLYRVFASELAGERVEPHDQEIIRTVGDYDRGVCGAR